MQNARVRKGSRGIREPGMWAPTDVLPSAEVQHSILLDRVEEVKIADTWNEIAHKAFEEGDKELIQADATNVTKFGAPAVAVVTALLIGLLGASWKLDPSRPAVLFAAAIIVAAIMIGIYFAFASDVRTRGAVSIARFDAITKLATEELDAANANKRAEEANAAQRAAESELAEVKRERDAVKATVDMMRKADANGGFAEFLMEIQRLATPRSPEGQ
jgi:hypothetical protein